MVVKPSDLTALARIRNAALDAFAADGLAATSIRDVANAAGVSSGLVQHYFSTKADLRAAVNEHVAAIAVDAFSDLASGTPAERADEIGDRITAFLQEHPTIMLYVARALTERDDDALGLFDALIGLAQAQWAQLADDGLLYEDADLTWAPLQLVVMLLGTVLLEPAVSRHLPEPLLSQGGLRRWQHASTALFERGLYKAP